MLHALCECAPALDHTQNTISVTLSLANYAWKKITQPLDCTWSFSSLLTGLLGSRHFSSWATKKTRVSPHQSTQMASQKLRKTSTVSWKNMNQYILTRIKYASDEPFGPSKTVFLLMSNLFIFVCLHVMIGLPMTLSFWGHLATQFNSYDSVDSCLTVSLFDPLTSDHKIGI